MPPADDDLRPDDQEARLARLGDAMDAFLRFRASGRPDLAAEFLREHAPLRDLLEPMLAEVDSERAEDGQTPSAAESLGAGRTFGDYRLLREVGRGGMGTVYEAEQISLRRIVALKVLHAHLAWSARSIERFRSEAAAASRLRHPGIVPIHEVGECQGRHYFTMELVVGRPLSELVHRERFGVRADCSRAAEAAELIARVADALQHAHEHGLVHRDVKPHNILVGGDGTVRLLDFGLCKDLEPTSLSATQDFLGTPHYCSPEQATGAAAVGPAADVFALGIVLYELLARRRPFEGDTSREVLRHIEHGEYEPLGRAAPGTPRDLQTICHKALEPAPAARYATAGEFGADLRRFLRIEPIRARMPGPLARAGKWIRRHRLLVALCGTATLLLVGTPLAYAVHLQRTHAAVEGERQVLDRAEKLAFRSIEQTLSMLSEHLDRQPGPGSRQQPRIDAVVKLCESFLQLRADAPDRRERAARAYHQIAGIALQLGDGNGALAACERGLGLLALAGPEQSRGREELRGRLLRRQLFVRQYLDPSGGAEAFAEAVAQWQELAERTDADVHTVVEYAETLVVRARALADQPQRRLEAERLSRRALQVLSPARRAEAPAACVAAVRAETVLGHVLLWSGRTAEALACLTGVVAAIAALPMDPILAVEKTLAMAAIGDAQQRLQRAGEAEASLRAAIASAQALLAEYPGSTPLQRALLRSRVRLGSQLLAQRKVGDAEVLLREAAAAQLAASQGAAGEPTWMDRALLADLDVQLASCILIRCNGTGDCAEAQQLLHAACGLLERLVREQPEHVDFQLDLGAAWNNLAALENQQGDGRTAQQFAERAIAQQLAVLAAAPENRRARTFLGMHHGQLAYALARQGRSDEAAVAAAAAAEHAPRHAPTLRLAAEAATRAAVATAGDAARAPEDRDRAAAEQAKVAVAALQRLAEWNAAEARRWLRDERFAFLRGRADFAALVQQVGER